MKQYTLLYIITEDRVVRMHTFNSMKELRDYKNYYIPELKHEELVQVDHDGFVWFSEVRLEGEICE